MAFLALGLTESLALELAVDEPVYVDLAKHFVDRFVAIGEALSTIGGEGLWDPEGDSSSIFCAHLTRLPCA